VAETTDARKAAVARIVSAAKEVAEDDSLRLPLAMTTGLSREGVKLALEEHLETHPSDAEIDALIARAHPTSRVHVILSANIFTGALRAIAWARAAAPIVSVQSSSREPVFAKALVAAIADPSIFMADQEALGDLREGEIHVYGRAATIAKVQRRANVGVVVRGHGPGIGVAHVAASDSLDDAALAIARDVVPFDQRGCLSPRIVFVVGDMRRAEEFSGCLCETLGVLGKQIPRGDLSEDEAVESARYVESMRFCGSAASGRGYRVGISKTIVLPPVGRHVHIASIESDDALAEIAKPIASYVTAVGSSDIAIARYFSQFVRVSALGQMQRPPFDGPVDLRVL
jgi:hypothetical protein